MHITLDGEQLQLPDDTSMMNALAALSDRAHAQHRIVTSLTVGGKTISDRDLTPPFLNQQVLNVGAVQAVSQSLHTIIVEAKQAIDRFAAELRSDGQVLLAPLRSGTAQVGTIDAWLGRLADYTEMLEAGHAQGVDGLSSAALLPWIQELLGARTTADSIRVADLLEYELLPRLVDAGLAA
ncbi:MAG: hypothetical protein H8K09_09760 [Nitrospira sp.]|jgi:hypothetical protein|nr:hypothetical protein [Nitrospira sp.]ULA68899.1 MAG: hypothetical protein LZF62_380087 [Nitrospira sp.]